MQPYMNYPQYQQNNEIPYLQQQIAYLESRLKGAEAMQQYQQQPQQQMIQQPQQAQQQKQPQNGVYTRVVDTFDTITASDIPMDNTGAIFAKQDGSEIQVRRWSADGTIMTTSYKPVMPPTMDNNGETDISSGTAQKLELGLSDEATQAFMDRFNDLTNKMDAIENMISQSYVKPKSTSRTKKEADAE